MQKKKRLLFISHANAVTPQRVRGDSIRVRGDSISVRGPVKLSKYYFFSTLVLCLTGCTTVSYNPTHELLDTHNSKPAILKKMPVYRSWGAQGSLAVQTAEKGWSASFDWQQRYQYYRLSIFGPLGANRMLLSGNSRHAVLESAGRIEEATDAEMLLKKRLGWYLPVNSLHYWVQGSPAPGAPHKILHNAAGEIIEINQQGWDIQYQEYNNSGLPTLIELYYGKLRIRIAIREWML